MYSYVKEIHPPSSVDYSCSCNFRSPNSSDLILIRGNLFQLYTVIERDQECVDELQSNPITSITTEKPKSTKNEVDDFFSDQGKKLNINKDEDELIPYPEFDVDESYLDKSRGEKLFGLRLVNQWSLMGKIKGISKVKNASKSIKGADQIILSFAQAKMSVVEFDHDTQNILTSSIHFYEHERYQRQMTTEDIDNKIEIDPNQACAVMQVYHNYLAVLPLTSESTGNHEVNSKRKNERTSFVLDLDTDELQIRNIRDMVFLSDYNEPTLAILYEPTQTWAGTLNVLSDSCVVAIASIDIESESITIIYKVNDLPYDTFRLLPLPKPIGGMIALSSTSIIHIGQGFITFMNFTSTIGTVGSGKHTKEWIKANEQPFLNLNWRLDGAQATLIGFRHIAIWNELGELGIVELFGDLRGVNKISINMLIKSPTMGGDLSTWECKVDPKLALVSSTISDLGCFKIEPNSGLDSSMNNYKTSGNTNRAQVLLFVGTPGGYSLLVSAILNSNQVDQALFSSDITQNTVTSDSMDLDDMLYDVSNTSISLGVDTFDTSSKSDEIEWRIHDKLICAAPLVQIDIGESNVGRSILKGDDNLELVGSVGIGPQGGLVSIKKYIRPSVLASFDISQNQAKLRPGISVSKLSPKRVWNVCVGDTSFSSFQYSVSDSKSFLSFSQKQKNYSQFHSSWKELVVVTSETITTVFKAQGELVEIPRTGFANNEPTLYVGQLQLKNSNNILAVQVCSGFINVIGEDLKCITKTAFEKDEFAVQAESCKNYVSVKLFSGKVRLYYYDSTKRSLIYINESETIINALDVSLFFDKNFGASRKVSSSVEDVKNVEVPLTEENISRIGLEIGGFLAKKPEKDDFSDCWVVVVDKLSTISVYLLPQVQCLWRSERIDTLPNTLYDFPVDQNVDSGVPESNKSIGELGLENTRNDKSDVNLNIEEFPKMGQSQRINQIKLVQLGDSIEDTYFIVLLSTSEIILYKCFLANPEVLLKEGNINSIRIGFRFSRLAHNTFTYYPGYKKVARELNGWDSEDILNDESSFPKTNTDQETYPIEKESSNSSLSNQEKVNTNQNDKIRAPNALIDDKNDTNLVDNEKEFEKVGIRTNLDDTSKNSIENGAMKNETVDPKIIGIDSEEGKEKVKGAAESDLFVMDEIVPDLQNKSLQNNITETTIKIQPPKIKKREFSFKDFEFSSIIPYKQDGVYKGVFILGAVPVWLLVGRLGYPRLHPMRLVPFRNASVSKSVDYNEALNNNTKSALLSSVIGWAPLQGGIKSYDSSGSEQQMCSSFVSITWSGVLVVGSLPVHTVDYDNPWPTMYMPIGQFSGVGMLASLTYHPTAKSYITATTRPGEFYLKDGDTEKAPQVVNKTTSDDEKGTPSEQQHTQAQLEQKRSEVVTTTLPPVSHISFLELISPVTFETVDLFELEPNEIVTCMKTLMLESQQTDSGKKVFLVVGTTFVLGEDTLTRGHIYIFDIISVVPDPRNPQRTRRLKRVCKEEMRGGISSIESLHNCYLVVAIGSKLFDEPSKILILGKDHGSVQALHSNFLVFDNTLSIVVADSSESIQTFVFDPNNIHSYSGQKLLKCGSFHLGSSVTCIKRLVGKLDHRLWINSATKVGPTKSNVQMTNEQKISTNTEFCLMCK
ncbi:hypothetical protein BB558_005661 [Smittium angustum]|uniref:Cleavage/polyadenylation specificity factor A subunit C-terminal domain-containing protein n=1 Tax=Smittium angustum TaxID=133377 RepID=A0A2U1IZV3_SMIAN|nr:hypothetical protein BB558_005661 [Smittium angustum]